MAYTVKVAAVDRTSAVETGSLVVRSVGYAGTGTCELTLLEPAAAPTVGQELEVLDGATTIFKGPIRTRERSEVGRARKKRYALGAQDQTSLLADDVCDTGANRTATETDKARVEWLLTTFGTKGVVGGATVIQVLAGNMPGAQDFTGMTLYEAIAEVAKVSGALLYVAFDKSLHYFASESNPAPFNLSDAPDDVATFGYRDLLVPEDAVELVNAVYVIGADDLTPIFRPDPATWPTASHTTYGRRERTLRDTSLTSVAAQQAAGDAYITVHDHPRGPLSLKVYKAGLRAGMVTQLTNATWAISAASYRASEVEAAVMSGTERFEYRVTLGDPPVTLASQIGGQALRISGLVLAAAEAAQLADLSVGGANLVPNSSFESAVSGSWDVGASWVGSLASADPFHKTKVGRGTPVGGTLGDLVSTSFIAVDRLDDYWLSAWSRMLAYTSGTGQFFVREYDAASTLLATTIIGSITAVESAWARHSARFGPNGELGRIAWQATTTKIKVGFRSPAAATFTWEVDGVQVERGSLRTAYAPSPQELVDQQIGTTQIADDAVTTAKVIANAIVAGKIAANAVTAASIAATQITGTHINALDLTAQQLILRDISGQTALDAAGFGPVWRRFIVAGLYNSDFKGLPPTPGSDISIYPSTTNVLPFWEHSTDGDVTVRSVADTTAPSGRIIRFTLTNVNGGAQWGRIYQSIPIGASRSAAASHYIIGSFTTAASVPASTTLFIIAEYLNAAGQTTGLADLPQLLLTNVGPSKTTAWVAVPNGGVIPADAYSLKVQIGMFRQSGSATGTLDLSDVTIAVDYKNVPSRQWKDPVRAATTAALPASTATYNRLEANANGPLAAQDGVTLVVGDRLLIKDESATNVRNGIWVLDKPGATDSDPITEVTSQRNSNATSGATTIDMTFPDTPVVGDLLLIGLAWRGDATITGVPSGWNLGKAGGNGAGIDTALYYKIAGASEPKLTTWTLSSSVKAVGVSTAINNGTGWPAGTGSLDKTNSNTATGTAGTTGLTGVLTQANEVVITLFGNIGLDSWSAFDNSQTEVGEASSSGGPPSGRCNVAMGRRVVAATTSVNYGATLGASQIWSSLVATFKATAPSGTGQKWAFVRAPDADATGEILPGAVVVVAEGTVNADSLWELTTNTVPIQIGTTAIGWSQVASAKGPRGELGYAAVTAQQGSITAVVDLTSLSVTITGDGTRKIKITGYCGGFLSSVSNDEAGLLIREGSTQLQAAYGPVGTTAQENALMAVVRLIPSSGPHTYKLSAERHQGTGSVTMQAGATFPAFILVEDIGT